MDFGYTPDFFGDSDTLDVDGKIATLMANMLIGGRHHGASPYIALGAGLIRTNINGLTGCLDIHATKNNWGGNIGGGVFIGSGNVTFRGDVRYFKSFDTSGRLPRDHGRQAGVLARNGRRRLHVVTTGSRQRSIQLRSGPLETQRRRAAETRHRRRHQFRSNAGRSG